MPLRILIAIAALCGGAALAPACAQSSPATPQAAPPSAAAAMPSTPPPTYAPPKVTSPAAAAHDASAATDPLAAMAWLRGCWSGKVNQREYTEQWTSPAAGMMLGLGHTVMNGKTLSYEFMRIVARADGKIAYVLKPTDKPDDGFVYAGTRDDRGMTGYVFGDSSRDFPAQIIYQRTPGGELFAYVKGKINGADREVIYPFHHVDCMTGKLL